VRGLPHHELATGSREDGYQADLHLRLPRLVPRNPDTVGRAELRGTIVLGELFGSERKLTFWRTTGGALTGVVIAIDDELALHGHWIIRAIIEIDATAKPARGNLTRLVEDSRSPDHRQFDGRWVFAFLHFR
jgi:hypothetical protein